jgi:hypothetical protein
MAPFASPAASRFHPLDGVFATPTVAVDPTPPFTGLAGFSALVQFSRRLLQVEVARSLGRHSLSPLNTFVPWGSIALPAPILANLPPLFHLVLTAREARLELRLVNPYIAGLRWPVAISRKPDGGVATTARQARGIDRRIVDIGWRLEINVLTAKVGGGVLTADTAPSSGTPASPGGVRANKGAGFEASTGAPLGGSGESFDRLTLAAGTVVTGATAELVLTPALWRFGMALDFSETHPSVTSETKALIDFFVTNGGKGLLENALAPLKATAGIKLTPDVAPGGALSATDVQRWNLPPFRVRDLLLDDGRGNPVLCLCAELGNATGGVARLVQPFLQGGDFAYGVSTDVLSPALKARWYLAASGFSVIGETPVDLPANGDASHTVPGTAQVQVSFSNILDDVSIPASTDHRGDPIRLLSKQRIQLLHLWDENGKPVGDLGPLAEPNDMPFVLPVNFFDRGSVGAPPDTLQANFRDFLFKLMAIIPVPILETLSMRGDSASGFASSAMKAFFIRWALKRPLDDVRPPTSGSVEAQV